MGTHSSNRDSQKVFHSAKKSTTDAIKGASKSAIQKTAGAAVNLLGNKTADEITSASNYSKKLCSQNNLDETDMPKEIYISQKKKKKKKTTNYWWSKISII